MSSSSPPCQGMVTYWSPLSGFGFVRSEEMPGRFTIYRDSFPGHVDEVNLIRRMVRFKMEDMSGDVLEKFELVTTRERTWSERVQDCNGTEKFVVDADPFWYDTTEEEDLMMKRIKSLAVAVLHTAVHTVHLHESKQQDATNSSLVYIVHGDPIFFPTNPIFFPSI